MFHPDRMASRILGMGDVLSLIEDAQMKLDEKAAEKKERKKEAAQRAGTAEEKEDGASAGGSGDCAGTGHIACRFSAEGLRHPA